MYGVCVDLCECAGCVQVYAGTHEYAWLCMAMHGCVRDEFSE